jgi:hypothetical protein
VAKKGTNLKGVTKQKPNALHRTAMFVRRYPKRLVVKWVSVSKPQTRTRREKNTSEVIRLENVGKNFWVHSVDRTVVGVWGISVPESSLVGGAGGSTTGGIDV